MSDWKEGKRKEVIDGILSYFEKRKEDDPEMTLKQIDQELDSQFFRLGNDWTGRGIVMDTVINATIEALEIVRSHCLERLEEKQSNSSLKEKQNET